jgi:hypothetical protein
MITYAIGLPKDVFRRSLKRYGTYEDAVYWRPNFDYDVLYVYKGEDIVLILTLEEMFQRFGKKPYAGSFKFHYRIERILRFCLRGHQ